jgi:hypothetical protein
MPVIMPEHKTFFLKLVFKRYSLVIPAQAGIPSNFYALYFNHNKKHVKMKAHGLHFGRPK